MTTRTLAGTGYDIGTTVTNNIDAAHGSLTFLDSWGTHGGTTAYLCQYDDEDDQTIDVILLEPYIQAWLNTAGRPRGAPEVVAP